MTNMAPLFASPRMAFFSLWASTPSGEEDLFKSLKTLILVTLLPLSGWAYSTDTLPGGVRSANLRIGWVEGLTDTYGDDRKLYDLGAKHSIAFDAATLARVNSEAQTLIQALNAFGSGALGSKIHLGTLKIDTRPEVQYTAPVFGYGINDKWTMGVGLPWVHYKNQVGLSSESSNLDFYRSQFSGLSQELDRALNINLASEAQRALVAKGYRSLEDRDESYAGDMQIALLHHFDSGLRDIETTHQMTFVLPTGPAYNSDDLMALNIFGRTSFDNTLTLATPIGPRWIGRVAGTLKLPIPDRVVMRVPRDDDDNLPDENQKQNVQRQLGMSRVLGGELEYLMTRAFSLAGATEYTQKDTDKYSGSGRVDLLSKNTNSDALRWKATATYSTVAAYKANQFVAPGMVALEVSDTIAGTNIERQTKAEMNLYLFF